MKCKSSVTFCRVSLGVTVILIDSELSRKFEKNQKFKKMKNSGKVFKQPLTIEQAESVMRVHLNTFHASAETLKMLDTKLTKIQMVLVQNCQICLQAEMVSRSFNFVPTYFVASQPAQKLCVDLSFWLTPFVNGCKILLLLLISSVNLSTPCH